MMQYLLLLFFNSFILTLSENSGDSGSDSEFGGNLVASLTNDANLDLSVDEDYEDLRAELLAYHTALAALPSRRSLITTPCWALGGICINHNLCVGHKYLTEVPGCKNKLNVCCFAWNRYQVRDWRDKGVGNVGFPWSLKQDFGGEVMVTCKDYKQRIFPVLQSLPPTYKDIFAIKGGKPTLGTMKATCWARGGVCVELRSCPSYNYFDAMVPGCDTGTKVCCKLVKFGSPTVGTQRKREEVLIFSEDLEELTGDSVESIALHNSEILKYS